jgi:citrate synthase
MDFQEQHTMGVLAALTSALTAFNPKSVNVDNEMYQAVCKTMGNSSYCNMDIQKSMGYPLIIMIIQRVC